MSSFPMAPARQDAWTQTEAGVKGQGQPGEASPGPMDLLAAYRSQATIHGVALTAKPDIYSHRKYIWILLIVAMTVGLAINLALQLTQLLSYPIMTETVSQPHPNLTFPAVTLCNLNSYQRHRLPNNSAFLAVVKRASQYFATKIALQRELRLNISEEEDVDGDTLHDFAVNASQPLTSLLKECRWDAGTVACSQVFTPLMTDLGMCYTFNQDGRWVSTFAGSSTGLYVRINIEQDYYYYSKTAQAGVKVVLLGQGVHPFPNNNGFLVAPGFSTQVAISRHETKGLPAPYRALQTKYCVDTESPDFVSPLKVYRGTYTRTMCVAECLKDKLRAVCGCMAFFVNSTGPFCSAKQLIDCYLPEVDKMTVSSAHDCDCYAPCHNVDFPVSLSTASLVSDFINKDLVASGFVSDLESVRRNQIEIRLYYSTLMVNTIVQKPLLTLNGIIASVGGLMGLFLGASLVSVVELTELALLMATACCRRVLTRKDPDSRLG